MEERVADLNIRVNRLEVELEYALKAEEDFRDTTRTELSDIRKDTKNIMRMAIIGLASLATVIVGWGLQLLLRGTGAE